MASTSASRRFTMAARLAVVAAATTVGAITMTGPTHAEASTSAPGRADVAVPITNGTTAGNVAAVKRLYFCVAYNNVRYWRAPNHDPLGQIHKGQGLNWRASRLVDGVRWDNVDLWGGRANVWVLRSNTAWCG